MDLYKILQTYLRSTKILQNQNKALQDSLGQPVRERVVSLSRDSVHPSPFPKTTSKQYEVRFWILWKTNWCIKVFRPLLIHYRYACKLFWIWSVSKPHLRLLKKALPAIRGRSCSHEDSHIFLLPEVKSKHYRIEVWTLLGKNGIDEGVTLFSKFCRFADGPL